MFYKKKGIPEEDEIVVCTVKRVLPHSIFVNLDEYDNKEAMIHISEISPGRIRNIRDFVREEKVIICKILRVHQEKKHIDLSLRRVSLAQRKKKEEEYKQEQKAEKLIELFVKNEKITMAEFYEKLGEKLIEEYSSLSIFFKEVLTNDIKSQDKLTQSLVNTIKEKIKLPEVHLESIITIRSKDPNGINMIKETFKKTEDFAIKQGFKAKFLYISAPKYSITVTAINYKDAEKILQKVSDFAVNFTKPNNVEATWQKKS